MKQFKMTLAAVFAASILMVSCGKKSAADLAKAHCKYTKEAGSDPKKMEEAGKKAEKEMEDATKDMTEKEKQKFALEYLEAAIKCNPELK